MGASSSRPTRPRRASSDVTRGHHRTQIRSASGTFLKTESHSLTPWYPATPTTSRSPSPRSSRSSFAKIPENEYFIDHSNLQAGTRQQRAGSRSFLGRKIRRKRSATSSSIGSTSTIEGAEKDTPLIVNTDRTSSPNSLRNGSEINGSDTNLETVLLNEVNTKHEEKVEDVDNVFFDAAPRPRLASEESSCSDEEPATQNRTFSKKYRSETLVYRASVEEKAVQTDQVIYPDGGTVNASCDHCRRQCCCFRNDPYDSNSSTQSLKLYSNENSTQRRKRWSPLIRKRQLILKQTAYANASAVSSNFPDKTYQAIQRRPLLLHSQPNASQSLASSSATNWHIQYQPKRRPRRTFSEDQADDVDSPFKSQSVNTNSDPSLCSERSLHVSDIMPSDHMKRARLYTICLQKAKMPLVKSSSCSPTVPLRRQTWSEKSRPQRAHCDGQKKTKGFLYLLRNLRSSCSETDISLEHRPSVDSNGYVDPFYITRNFNRLNLKRVSLSHPNLNTTLRGNTTPPSSLKGKVSAAVGRLERALTGRSMGRTYSMESQQSTSTGWNSDLPASPTDSDITTHTHNKYQNGQEAENGYMTFDPELNPPVPRTRRLLSSSCSSAPSSPGFQDATNTGFNYVSNNNGWEKDSIYESLDNFSPKRRSKTLKSLPSSDGETPPEVPPRPPLHRQRHRERMLRRQLPLPPIPITQCSRNIEESSKVPLTITSTASSVKPSNKTTSSRRQKFVFGQSSSCGKLPSFQMDSSEEDSVFDVHEESTPNDKTQTSQTIIKSGVCAENS